MKNLLLLLLVISSSLNAKDTVLLENVQGAWKCIYSVYDDPTLAHELSGPWHLGGPDNILIENDSLFEFHFPCELVRRYKISIKHDSIFDETPASSGAPQPKRSDEWPATISLEGDTLVIKTCDCNEWFERTTVKRYIRTTLDPASVARLKKYTLNVDCLYGRWKLETSYDSGYDGNGTVNYQFPFAPQHILVFTSNSRIDYSDQTMWLRTDSVARPFIVAKLSSDGKSLDLQTGDWYKGSWPWTLHYVKVE